MRSINRRCLKHLKRHTRLLNQKLRKNRLYENRLSFFYQYKKAFGIDDNLLFFL